MGKQKKVKHQLIYDHVHRGILGGDYAVGQRIPTEAELGSRFAASRVTVARALRDLEREGLLVRRRGAGTFVRQPENVSTRLIGLITGETPGVFSIVGDQISRAAQARGFAVVLGKWPIAEINQIIRHTQELAEQYIARQIAGVIFEPMYVPADQMHFNEQIAATFTRAEIPLVLLDREIYDYPRRSQFDLVGIDNRHGGYVLTEHLLSLGRRRIHFLSQALVASTVTARLRGYQDALAQRGIECRPDWIHLGDAVEVDYVRQLMRNSQVEAFVCANDFEAAKLLHALTTLGVRVPYDVSIVGFNDDAYARLLTVALTTVRQPCQELGRAAVKMILERIEKPDAPPREIRLACELVVRESCGAALAGAAAGSGR